MREIYLKEMKTNLTKLHHKQIRCLTDNESMEVNDILVVVHLHHTSFFHHLEQSLVSLSIGSDSLDCYNFFRLDHNCSVDCAVCATAYAFLQFDVLVSHFILASGNWTLQVQHNTSSSANTILVVVFDQRAQSHEAFLEKYVNKSMY